MDGHKCQKFYILMHKYIADIVVNFLKYIKKITPLHSNFCPNFNFYPIFILLNFFPNIFQKYSLLTSCF